MGGGFVQDARKSNFTAKILTLLSPTLVGLDNKKKKKVKPWSQD